MNALCGVLGERSFIKAKNKEKLFAQLRLMVCGEVKGLAVDKMKNEMSVSQGRDSSSVREAEKYVRDGKNIVAKCNCCKKSVFTTTKLRCPRSTFKKGSFLSHRPMAWNGKKADLKCTKCKDSLSDPVYFKQHLMSPSSEDKDAMYSLCCKHCHDSNCINCLNKDNEHPTLFHLFNMDGKVIPILNTPKLLLCTGDLHVDARKLDYESMEKTCKGTQLSLIHI